MMRSRIAAAALFAALLFLITGCGTSDSTSTTQSAEDIAYSAYQKAADSLNASHSLSVYIGTETQTTIGTQTFSQTSQQQMDFSTDSANGFLASVQETVQIGSHSFTISELYANGVNYIKLNDNLYKSPVTATEFSRRFAPAVQFDTSLYQDIQAVKNNGSTQIVFDQPAGAETWAIPEGAEFCDAQGYALINSNGALTESTYTVSYLDGNASVTKTVKLVIRGTDVQIAAPTDTESYIPLEYQDAPRLAEQAFGYLLQATSIQSHATESINCQAFSISRTQTSTLTMSGNEHNFFASLDTSVTQSNQSSGKKVMKQLELFQDGIYSISSNGGTPTQDASVNVQAMMAYCQAYLEKDIILSEHIVSASFTETEQAYRITFRTDQSSAEEICAEICDTLYTNPTLLDTLASSSSLDIVEYTLEIDRISGLPVASGLNFSATHIIETIPYQLSSQRTQTYQYN